MKLLKIILVSLLLTACSNKKSTQLSKVTNGKMWNIKLENNLGNVEIVLPKHLDTFFSWIQHSDCGDPCAYVYYRVQSKASPIFKESGFYYRFLTDSVEQFTIKHSKVAKPWPIIDTSLVRQFVGRLKNEAFENHSNKFMIDTILKIDDRNIAVIAFRNFDSIQQVTVHSLNAITSIDGNLIELYFENRKKYQDTTSNTFIQTSFNALQTIKISKN